VEDIKKRNIQLNQQPSSASSELNKEEKKEVIIPSEYVRTMKKDLANLSTAGSGAQAKKAPPPKDLPIKKDVSGISSSKSKTVSPSKKEARMIKSKEGVLPSTKTPIPKKKIKPLFIGIGVFSFLFLVALGVFFYWRGYLRSAPFQEATHYECQDFQCVEVTGAGTDQCQNNQECQPVHYECKDSQCVIISGTGEDECQSDEDCQLVSSVSTPTPLLLVDETEDIQLKENEISLINNRLKDLSYLVKEKGNLSQILISIEDEVTKEAKYIDLDTFLTVTGIIFPESIQQIISSSSPDKIDNYTLFSYSQETGRRLGLVIKINQENVNLSEALKAWESSIRNDLTPLFLQDEIPSPATEEFQDNFYKGVGIRYINFPTPELSIDYAVIGGKLIIATSKESAYAVIDRLKEGENE